MTDTKKKKQKTYHHGNLRQTLLEVALRTIDEQGVHSLSLRELARRAHVSQAAPYRHFASKEALVDSVAEQGFRLLATHMKEANAVPQVTPLEQFQQLAMAYVSFAHHHPAYFRLMFGPPLSSAPMQVGLQLSRQEVYDLLLGSLAACREAGWLREGTLDELTLCAWSMVHGLSQLLIDGRLMWLWQSFSEWTEQEIQKLTELVTHHLFKGIGLENAKIREKIHETERC